MLSNERYAKMIRKVKKSESVKLWLDLFRTAFVAKAHSSFYLLHSTLLHSSHFTLSFYAHCMTTLFF